MKNILLLLWVIFSAAQLSFCQIVEETVIIPIISIYKASELQEPLKSKSAEVAKKLKCSEYLVASTCLFSDECGTQIGELFKYAIQSKIKWVKYDVGKVGNMTYTLTTTSKTEVKPMVNDEKIPISYTLLPLCGDDKNVFSSNDTNVYLKIPIKVDKSKIDHLLFQTFKQGIYFSELSDLNCQFFTNPIMDKEQVNQTYKKMAENVQFVGKAMNEQNDSQNQKITKPCKYKDKMVFDAMQLATVEDVQMFLSYCASNPDVYRKNALGGFDDQVWTLAEVYATWLVAGMPLPDKKK